MRFLLDECLSASLVDPMAADGHDVIHLRELDLLGAIDDDVLAAARAERRILVSADTDFGELLANAGFSTPSLVLLRLTNCLPEQQAAVLLANLDAVAVDLVAGAVVVVTDDRLRVRELPIHRSTGPQRHLLQG